MRRLLWMLAVSTLLLGCAESHDGDASGGEHEHEAPHRGLLLELGDEFAHVELVRDGSQGTLTLYVLDGEAARGIRISQEAIVLQLQSPATSHITLRGRASTLTGETGGDTSEFFAEDTGLRGDGPLTGTIERIRVRGQEFENVPFTIGS